MSDRKSSHLLVCGSFLLHRHLFSSSSFSLPFLESSISFLFVDLGEGATQDGIDVVVSIEESGYLTGTTSLSASTNEGKAGAQV